MAAIIGALISVQYRSQAESHKFGPSRRVEDLVVLLKGMEKSNKQLSDQVIELQERLSKSRPPADLKHEPTAGTYPAVVGPGLLVTVTETAAQNKLEDGTSAVVHAEDLLKIVNELRSGGAEAISLNGRRLLETSEIVTAGQHIMVNKAPVVAPYTLQAIGPADDMKNTLALRGGVVEYLQFYGIEVKTKPEEALELPAAKEMGGFKFAKPAPPDQAKTNT
ncbi:MAG: hypothetical protein JWM80_3246 [Cyanobacteria bacterium RYN_339]|nr:hypothetical protein [Cyanobacteria bacterium RYN_339]